MRADRLLSLVLLLRHRGLMTAAALAQELEVSTRTVLRDVEALSTAGIPVYAERGRTGGFALLPGFSTDLTGLTPDEAVALLTSPARTTSDALGLGVAFSSAIRKVVAAMPETSRDAATDAAERVLVRRGGWLRDAADPGLGKLAAVQRAVFAGHRLRILYGSQRSESRWRTVDPLGLVEAAGQWYLLALDGGEDRTYRVSRIEETEELAEPADRPSGVDLEELWLRRRAQFRERMPGTPARIRVREERREELVRTAGTVTSVEPDAVEGWVVVDAAFGDVRHAERVVWSLAPSAAALDPPELVAALRDRADRVRAAHP
ncbi:helix-turn-helix transcriptional regulator [Pseudonocardia pini]|uniref:helix-turn-helix transcriptional regulator n=1 Tax=Pseudonocardia pini TaxID=2758030 RepID=UPI0015F00C10|nr:WYL domain-containing protein [Pseudonocardia pini]